MRWPLLAVVTGVVACGGGAEPAQVVPPCERCALRGGIFVEYARLRDQLVLATATRDAVAAQAGGAAFLDHVDGELGVAAYPDFARLIGRTLWVADAVPAPDGGWYVTGNIEAEDQPRVGTVLMRFDADGGLRWRQVFATISIGQRLVPLADGVLLMRSGAGGDELLGFGDDGALRFTRAGLPGVYTAGAVADGGLIVVGSVGAPFDPGSGLPPVTTTTTQGLYLVGLDRDGVSRWSRVLEATEPDGAILPGAVAIVPDGRVLVSSLVVGDGLALGPDRLPIPLHGDFGTALVVLEIGADGRLAWGFTDGTDQPAFTAIAPIAGGAVVGGWIHTDVERSVGGVGFGPSDGVDAIVVALGPDGVRWQESFGGPATQDQLTLAVAPSGAVFAAVASARRDDDGVEPVLHAGDATLRGPGTFVVELGR